MRTRFWREDAGQVIVIVGAAMMVLLGSLALAVDWGYGLAVRRAMQNSADAAALGVGRNLATSTIVIDGTLRFLASDQQLWTRADTLVAANRGLAETITFTLEYANEALVWTASQGAGSTARVPDDTVYVRVRASTTYESLMASATGYDSAVASASARVRLSGATTPLAPIIPLMRHMWADVRPSPADPADSVLSTTCPLGGCGDPTDALPTRLWDNGQVETYGKFEGVADLSRYSRNEAVEGNLATQLMADWDRTGSPSAGTPLKTDQTGRKCPLQDGLWDTAGNEDNARQNKHCSAPNWFYYDYGGAISLTSSYLGVPLPREAPEPFPAVSQTWCALTDAQWQARYGFIPDPRAPCDRGDWVETVEKVDAPDMDNAIDALELRLASAGGEGVLSDKIVAGGPKNGQSYGNALTVLIMLWDCGEEFSDGPPPGLRWRLVRQGQDCTAPDTGVSEDTPGRVHILTVAPFTIYQGLTHKQDISGYWGGVFGDPPAGPPKPLWVFANTAYLVPDED